MGNGNIDVGTKTPTRRPGRPIVENLAGSSGSSGPQIGETSSRNRERPRICVAMTQQCRDSGRGNQSSPQKFLQLVGCRDPNARPAASVRPRPAPGKAVNQTPFTE